MKRNNRKLIYNIFSAITVLLFVLLLIVTCVLFFVIPKKDYSVVEKRKLTSFPKFSFHYQYIPATYRLLFSYSLRRKDYIDQQNKKKKSKFANLFKKSKKEGK